MRIRQAAERDVDRVLACMVTEPIGWASESKYREHLAVRSYRPEWTWIAEDGDRIVARVVLWGFADARDPLEIDCLFVDALIEDRVGICAELVSSAIAAASPVSPPLSYQVILPPTWQADADIAAAVEWRAEAVKRAGLGQRTERLRFEWTADTALPVRSQRLEFEQEPADAVWLDLFARVAVGSLDTATRRGLERLGHQRSAREALDGYQRGRGYEWWRVARLGDDLVGFAIPSHYEGGYVVSYLGVVPEFRGHRFADDLLAEATRVLRERGAERIVADVDAANAPMTAAFERMGYRNFAVRLVMRG